MAEVVAVVATTAGVLRVAAVADSLIRVDSILFQARVWVLAQVRSWTRHP